MLYILIVYGVINAVALALYGADKLSAILGGRRVPEVVLLTFAALFGGLGATLGMICFRHKIRKPRFRVVYVFAAVQAAAVVALCVWLH